MCVGSAQRNILLLSVKPALLSLSSANSKPSLLPPNFVNNLLHFLSAVNLGSHYFLCKCERFVLQRVFALICSSRLIFLPAFSSHKHQYCSFTPFAGPTAALYKVGSLQCTGAQQRLASTSLAARMRLFNLTILNQDARTKHNLDKVGMLCGM